MTVRASKAWRWAPGAAVGIVCLFVGESGLMTQGTSVITQANARSGRPLKSLAHVAPRTTRRAISGGAVAGTIYLGEFGNSGGTFYGYAPGAYGGLGCYRNAYGVLVCP
jgi:hypothetical protein